MKGHSRRWHQRAFLTSGWVCPVCDDNPNVYQSPEELFTHLSESHRDQFTADRLQAISRQSKTDKPRPWNECLFCCFTVDDVGPPDKTKRVKEPHAQRNNKSMRMTLEMRHPNPHREAEEKRETESEDSDDSSMSEAPDDALTHDNAEMMARHIAGHLQVLMLLTIRLLYLQEEEKQGDDGVAGDVNSDSVDIGDSENSTGAIGDSVGRGSKKRHGAAAVGSDQDLDIPDRDEVVAVDTSDNNNNNNNNNNDDDDDDDMAAIPDAVMDLSDIPRQYDNLPAEKDDFLQKMIKSGAYQSHSPDSLDPVQRAVDETGLLEPTLKGIPSPYSNPYFNRIYPAPSPPPPPPPPPQAPQHFGYGAPQGYRFQYSQCTGRRKALLIGINYFGQRGQLRGCISDIRNMAAYLVENFGYKREDMVILTDDQHSPMSQPIKQNILRAMHWLVKDARPHDSLFFHYSGK